MKHSLEVFFNDELIFVSDGKWLYPLFELENFLKQQTCPAASLIIKDKIVGRAAALLHVKLGLKTVKAAMMSDLGKEIFEHFQVNYEYENLVPRIKCRTEEILRTEFDAERAYFLLSRLAHKNNLPGESVEKSR